MPSVASFMMPAAKCVTAMPEDKLSSVVASLVNEKIGCVVVVDPASERAVGIVTKQDVNRMFLNQVRTAVLVVTDTERQRDAAAPRGLRAVCFPPDGSDVPDTPTETPACVGRGILLSRRRVRGERTPQKTSRKDERYFSASSDLLRHERIPPRRFTRRPPWRRS